jgi:hypothetical protein
MPPTRREFLKIIGIIALPLPDVALGAPIILYMSLIEQGGWEVTRRMPVEFRWNHAMTIKLGEGHNFTFSGIALWTGIRKKHPLRVKPFAPVHMIPTITLEINYTLKDEIGATNYDNPRLERCRPQSHYAGTQEGS